MNIIEKLRWKIGIWLIQGKIITAESIMLSNKVKKTKCVHCGKNPYFKD